MINIQIRKRQIEISYSKFRNVIIPLHQIMIWKTVIFWFFVSVDCKKIHRIDDKLIFAQVVSEIYLEKGKKIENKTF